MKLDLSKIKELPKKIIKKKDSPLQIAQENADQALKDVNLKINELGLHTSQIHLALTTIQNQFDKIRNVPSEQMLECERLKNIRLQWISQAKKIDQDYDKFMTASVGAGAAGVGLGTAVVALGPTAVMGIATTFGVASTGTAISALSGAAATNAALAWLGGGALAAGGGGVAAGHAFLALAGPIGWAIAGAAFIGSGVLLYLSHAKKKRLEEIFTSISERDITSYKLAIVELNERMKRIDHEVTLLNDAIKEIETFGLDYSSMSEQQQYALGSYVNLMNSSTSLLVNPILGLQPHFIVKDIEKCLCDNGYDKDYLTSEDKDLVISLANLFYKIKLSEDDKELIYKSFKNNKEFLANFDLEKDDFDEEYIQLTCLLTD